MARPDVDLVVFDLGGTLVQDRGDAAEAFATVLAAHDVPHAPAEIENVRGRSKRDAIRRLLLASPGGAGHATVEGDRPARSSIEDRASRVYASFVQELSRRLEDRPPALVAGAIETVTWLRQRGVKTALTTGFDRVLAHRIVLAAEGLGPLLDAVVCADEVASGRPAPFMLFRAMERTHAVRVSHVMAVGDTEADLLAAANAGIGHAIGVLGGAHTRERLAMRPHTAILENVGELPSLWDEAAISG